jgi:hypothetical protein
LVRGSIEDWMRVRVGKMKIAPTITAAAGASPATILALAKGTPPFSVVATNARNKIYHGPTQWTPPEEVPTGIAQSVYESILAGVRFQGSVTLVADDIPLTPMVGRKLNLTGSAISAWTTMSAPIHSVTWDVDLGTVTLAFGPVPYLAPTDFLELQRILRSLPVRWWSSAERSGDKIGSEETPSAAGDTVGAFDLPETLFEPGGGSGSLNGSFYTMYEDGDGDTYLQGGTVAGGHGGSETLADYKVLDATTGVGTLSGKILWAEVTVSATNSDGILLPGLSVTAAAYGTPGTAVPDNEVITAASPTGKKLYYELGRWTDTTFLPAGVGGLATQACLGNWNLVRA